jgi:hypothetical protein
MAATASSPSRTPMKYFLTILIAVGLTGRNATAEYAMIDPAKYILYNCSALKDAIKIEKEKEQKLRLLMDKSSRGAGGEFVNLIAYRTEYLQAQGNQKLANRTLTERNCPKGR